MYLLERQKRRRNRKCILKEKLPLRIRLHYCLGFRLEMECTLPHIDSASLYRFRGRGIKEIGKVSDIFLRLSMVRYRILTPSSSEELDSTALHNQRGCLISTIMSV
jgi:hypothetical protein